jgi:hypothetical protein
MPVDSLDFREAFQQVRLTLARLSLVSHAPASRMDAMPRTHGTPEHRPPPGEANPPHERLGHELVSASTVEEVLAVGRKAHDELVAATRRRFVPSTVETADELAERVIDDGEGWAAGDVATAMRCTPTFVRRARLAALRDPEDGRPIDPEDPWEAARELRRRGRSLRAIAALTGVPRSTLHDKLA